MKTIVQKFGGTSIGTANRLRNVTKIIQDTFEQDIKPIAVVSAMSSGRKNDGTTSMLLSASDEALKRGQYHKVIDQLERYHLQVVTEAISTASIREGIKEEVQEELNKLKSFLDAIQVIEEISPRSMDVIISTGEKLSARILTGMLNSSGTDAIYIDLSEIVDEQFNEIDQRFCQYLQEKLGNIMKECGARIPVVTGFFGFAPNGIIKSIGRGYTDFTAALIAVGTQAEELQIWKEVDGIFTSDPNKVKNAKVLEKVTPSEASELTYFGSEVIHPFTMEQVINADIPVRIKNTFEPGLPGTIISPLQDDIDAKKGPTAVTVKRDIIIVNIQSNRMLMAYGFMAKIFNIFDKYELVIDLVSTSEVNVSLSLDKFQNVKPAIVELKRLGKVSINKEMAILSLVGQGMRNSIGIASQMFLKLADNGINIEVISQGASEINISCAIKDYDADKALRAVHEMLVEDD